jgi:hypothetical protein
MKLLWMRDARPAIGERKENRKCLCSPDSAVDRMIVVSTATSPLRHSTIEPRVVTWCATHDCLIISQLGLCCSPPQERPYSGACDEAGSSKLTTLLFTGCSSLFLLTDKSGELRRPSGASLPLVGARLGVAALHIVARGS